MSSADDDYLLLLVHVYIKYITMSVYLCSYLRKHGSFPPYFYVNFAIYLLLI